jgi:hypothetical protein
MLHCVRIDIHVDRANFEVMSDNFVYGFCHTYSSNKFRTEVEDEVDDDTGIELLNYKYVQQTNRLF